MSAIISLFEWNEAHDVEQSEKLVRFFFPSVLSVHCQITIIHINTARASAMHLFGRQRYYD